MVKIRENVPLAQYTYYKIGGKARYFCEISTQINTDTQADQHRYYQDVIDALNWAEEKGLPVFVLGGGANVLISDNGFDGLVIKIQDSGIPACALAYAKASASKKASAGKKIQDSEYMTVSAGVKLSDVVNFSLKHGLAGLEWAAGIPGSVGGAIRGNAGAFDHSMSEVIESVTVLIWKERRKAALLSLKNTDINADSRQKIGVVPRIVQRKFSAKDMCFGYRTSIIKEQGGIILEATLKLKRITNEDLTCLPARQGFKNQEEAKNHIKYRKEHHPLEYPSCGSVFKNVFLKALKNADINAEQRQNRDIGRIREIRRMIKTEGDIIPAGLLIAKAGLSGKKIGDAQISEKHSNFIINLGNAKAVDVYTLIKLCEKEVYRKFGVKLEREVELVGFADQR